MLKSVLKADAVPSIFFWTREEPSVNEDNSEPKVLPIEEVVIKEEMIVPDNVFGSISALQQLPMYQKQLELAHNLSTVVDTIDTKQNVQTQTTSNSKDKSVQTDPQSRMSVYNYQSDKKALYFYTGMTTFKQFNVLFKSLGSKRFCLSYVNGDPPKKICEIDQFFLTMMYLRTHKSHLELSVLFGVSISQVRNVLLSWIQFLYVQWKKIYDSKMFKDLRCSHSADEFATKFPKIQVLELARKYKVLQGRFRRELKNQIIFVCFMITKLENRNEGKLRF